MKLLTILSLLPFLLSASLFAETPFYTPEEDLKSLKETAIDVNLPNVLLLGDSISIGYTPATMKLLKGVANVRRPSTAPRVNCGDTTKGLKLLSNWLGEEKWDVIHFTPAAYEKIAKQVGVKVSKGLTL